MKLVLTGWKPGLRKISLTTLFVTRAKLGLVDAREQVERLLRSEVVEIEVASDQAIDLMKEMEELGVVGHIESGENV